MTDMDEENDQLSRNGTAQCAERKVGIANNPSAGQHDFKGAKQCILGTFGKIEELIANLNEIFSQTREEFPQEYNEYENDKAWFSECRKFLEKEKMKVVIFGSTSSGKSTTINAILHKRLLPSGMGHVTNCFLQIEGSMRDCGFLVKINEAEAKLEENLEKYLESKLSELSKEDIVYIDCPTRQSRPLQNDVMILDCPGLDKTNENDRMIFSNCKDADVFVFVSNAISTIRRTEVSFFENIEDPTVFILFNFWDLTDHARERDRAPKVRKQHEEDACDFLHKTNQHLKEKDLKDKIYFVSAVEALEKYETRKEDLEHQYGRDQRDEEFVKFEKAFWKYTTDSALRTRFTSRIANAKQQLKNFKENLEQISKKLRKKEKHLKQVVDDLTKRNRTSEDIIKEKEKERLSEILNLMEKDNIEEIANSFNPEKIEMDKTMWTSYYQGLHMHVQKQIKTRLQRILENFRKDAEENDRNELERCLKDKYSTETQNDTGRLQEQCDLDWKFVLPTQVNVDYAWSFGPYALMKKYFWYRSCYKEQSTTSTSRSVLQIGGYCTAMVVAAACPFSTIPAAGVGIAAITLGHYGYDRGQWTTESKVAHLKEMCAADIHIQFKEKYETELLKTIEKLDKDLLEGFQKRLQTCEEKYRSMYRDVNALNMEMTESKCLEIISKGENELDEFEKKYLRPDQDNDSQSERAQCDAQQKDPQAGSFNQESSEPHP